jgi:citrate lyase subunit beta/citryl-CoA lyase
MGISVSSAASFLFVPGDRPERFDKARDSGADCVILDLEDAVAPAAKAAARAAAHAWLAAGGTALVRVNGADTEWFADDLRMVQGHEGAGILLPKAEPEAVATVTREYGTARPLVPLVESVAGLFALRRMASMPGVVRVAFGSVDFALDSGIADARDALAAVRTQIVLESAYARVTAPIDGITVAIDDGQQAGIDAAAARHAGFGGKLCIHPRQVAAVNEAFAPTAAQLAWAREVIDAWSGSGGGAVALNGKMIDRPVVEAARRLLALMR